MNPIYRGGLEQIRDVPGDHDQAAVFAVGAAVPIRVGCGGREREPCPRILPVTIGAFA
jgi:hypothetical protein